MQNHCIDETAIDYIYRLKNEQTIGHLNWSKTKSEKTNNSNSNNNIIAYIPKVWLYVA